MESSAMKRRTLIFLLIIVATFALALIFRAAHSFTAIAPPIRPTERPTRRADSDVLARLDRKLPEIKFDAVGLNDVIEFLKDVTSQTILVDWSAIEAAGIARNAPVS